MKNLLSDADYDRAFACIEAIHRCRSLDDFPRHVLGELRKVVECYLAGYNEVNLPRNRFVVVFDPPREDIAAHLYEKFAGLMHEHPVITYFDKTGDGQALKISDFLTAQEYHERALYRDCYQHVDVEDQLSFAVQISPGFMIGIAFNRQERSFNERDRLLLNLLRPHIIQAYLTAAELTGQQQREIDLHEVLRASGLGVIAASDTGEVLHATPGSFECLAHYLPIPAAPEHASLPSRLTEWLREERANPAPGPLVLQGDVVRLVIRRVASKDRWLLLLSEETIAEARRGLDHFHLTPREQEVLHWIGEGKSNSEIAVILGLSRGTVKLHVERILAKLGVEHRTAAALIAHGIT